MLIECYYEYTKSLDFNKIKCTKCAFSIPIIQDLKIKPLEIKNIIKDRIAEMGFCNNCLYTLIDQITQ